jgi:hypothetical protein
MGIMETTWNYHASSLNDQCGFFWLCRSASLALLTDRDRLLTAVGGLSLLALGVYSGEGRLCCGLLFLRLLSSGRLMTGSRRAQLAGIRCLFGRGLPSC